MSLKTVFFDFIYFLIMSFEETYVKKRAESLLLLTSKLVSLNCQMLIEICSAHCMSVSLVLSCPGDKTFILILVKEKP
jgi:hypothetical protein